MGLASTTRFSGRRKVVQNLLFTQVGLLKTLLNIAADQSQQGVSHLRGKLSCVKGDIQTGGLAVTSHHHRARRTKHLAGVVTELPNAAKGKCFVHCGHLCGHFTRTRRVREGGFPIRKARAGASGAQGCRVTASWRALLETVPGDSAVLPLDSRLPTAARQPERDATSGWSGFGRPCLRCTRCSTPENPERSPDKSTGHPAGQRHTRPASSSGPARQLSVAAFGRLGGLRSYPSFLSSCARLLHFAGLCTAF